MSTTVIERTAIHQAIDRLPDDALPDLADFIERLKSGIRRQERPRFKEVISLEGLWEGYDFSPEFIAEARRELWRGMGRERP